MIFDGLLYRQTLSLSDAKDRALNAFVNYLEKRLGVAIIKDVRDTPFGRPDLEEPLRLAELLKNRGIIKSYGQIPYLWSDEPRMRGWYAVCNDSTNHQVGGTTWENDANALYAALSEGLERYIWMTQYDYFIRPVRATEEKIAAKGPYVSPKHFVGFSEEQRAQNAVRQLHPDADYLWVQGTSLVSGKRIYVPAQVVTGIQRTNFPGGAKEPMIRQQNTNGLATWPTQNGARAAGALEVIEREAYMIMWMNQLTLPQIALETVCAQSPSLSRTVARCEKYQFKTHVLKLPTDAPTHAIAVVMEDMGGNAPRYTIGLKAHPSLPHAIEKAMTEAFRAFRRYRAWTSAGNVWDPQTPTEKVGHLDRLFYWGVPENARHLEFMIKGPEVEAEPRVWDVDTLETHFERIVQWCREKNLEYISIPLTASSKNPTSLHIEMAILPDLHPTYLNESVQQFGGTRWRDVPRSLGYAPLEKPFADRPHPFS